MGQGGIKGKSGVGATFTVAHREEEGKAYALLLQKRDVAAERSSAI